MIQSHGSFQQDSYTHPPWCCASSVVGAHVISPPLHSWVTEKVVLGMWKPVTTKLLLPLGIDGSLLMEQVVVVARSRDSPTGCAI